MEQKLSLGMKIKNLFFNDPKPIFDHFRNIGIAAVLALGASALRSFNLYDNPFYINNIAMMCSYVTFVIAMALLIINTSYAQVSINLFFFNKTKFEGVWQKLGSGIPVYSYTVILVALIVMYSFNSANERVDQLTKQTVDSEKLYLNIDKIKETVEVLDGKATILEAENNHLKEENEKLRIEVSQLNKLIQQTPKSGAAD